MAIYLSLFLEFFRIGLLSFGGGYATIPFLYHLAETQDWYTIQNLTDMIALASVTPGPVGVNAATYAGFVTSGVFGAMVATTSVILPSFIIVITLSKLLDKFKKNKYVQSVIYTLKPTGCGLLAAVGIDMFVKNINIFGMFLLAALLFAGFTEKRDPIFYIAISGVVGLIGGLLGLIH